MKQILMPLLAAFFLTSLVGRAQQNTPSRPHQLMPVPASLRFGEGRLPITPAFRVSFAQHTDGRLQRGVDRALRRLEARTGLEFARGAGNSAAGATLVVECAGPGLAVPAVEENEQYALEVKASQAVLRAATVVGVLRGLETLLQLVEGSREGFYLPAVQIEDKPRFPWRGLLIDVCRHWQPMEVMKRNLDGMAAVKLNVLHWHLTEDQGFRIESRRHPKLHELGSDGLYYTQAQVRELVEYARDRGIRVIPEFDIPGHATSWFVGYPEYASAPGPYQIERRYGIFDPTFDPTREETYKFLDGFLGEMAALFPDAYIHIGGDENNGRQWKANAQIQAFMRKREIKDAHELQAYFNQRLSQILTKHGKRMVGWDEVLHPALPRSIVVQSWRGQASLAASARQGYSGILSFGYYLDHIMPAEYHYRIDPIPPGTALTPEETARVLGGEACMWTEYVSPENIDTRIWPRLAAIAERLWSPREVTDIADMYRRLGTLRGRLEEVGLLHDVNHEKMLRRLAGSDQTTALRTLVEVVEPVKVYRRGQLRPTTQMTPLTRLVDTSRPDAEARHGFPAMVDALLEDAPRFASRRAQMASLFAAWRDVRPAFDVMADRSPVLREAVPLAQELAEMGTTGLEALSYLSEGVAPPAGWRESKLALLERASQPRAEVEFVILPALKKLIVAAAEQQALRTTAPEEWRKQVNRLSGAAK